MGKLKKVSIKMMISFMAFFGLNKNLLANILDYNTLTIDKKNIFKVFNKYREKNLIIDSYEINNIINLSNKKKEGEIFLDVMENSINKLNTEYFILSIFKNDYLIKNTINVFLKKIIDENIFEIGPSISYTYQNIDENSINTLDVGFILKAKIMPYKIYINAVQKLRYSNLLKNDIYGLNGGVKLFVEIGDDFKIIPNIHTTYTYDIKKDISDKNNDKIKLNNSFDFLFGAGANFEYNKYMENLKFGIGLSYNFSKMIMKKNKYVMFNMLLVNDIENNQVQTLNFYSNFIIKDIHNIGINIAYNNEYVISALYSVNF